jgi:hypothetical protein
MTTGYSSGGKLDDRLNPRNTRMLADQFRMPNMFG